MALLGVAISLVVPRAAVAQDPEQVFEPLERRFENEGEVVAAAGAYAYMAHGGPLGNLGPAARLSAAQQAAAVPATPPTAGTWREVGPKPYNNDDPTYPSSLGPFGLATGQITALAVEPTNVNVVYAGAASGGIWKSTDGGGHWKPIGDDLASLAFGSLAVDPAHPQTVFAGTGDANTNFDAYSGVGIYRSKDGGNTWERVEKNLTAASTVFHIEIGGGRIFVATNKGLFRSTDGGDSYNEIPLPTNAAGTAKEPGPFANFVTDVRIKPGTPDQVTAAIGWRNGKAQSPGNGLYRSTTGGAPGSFTRMTTTGLGLPNIGGDAVGRISLAYASGPNQDHNILWAVVHDAGLQRNDTLIGQELPAKYTVLNGVFRSGNDGALWDLKATSETLYAAPGTAMTVRGVLLYAPGVQAWYNQWIAVDPTNADSVLLGLEEIYRTVLNANGPGPAVWESIGRYSDPCPELPQPTIPPCPPGLGLFVDADLPGGFTTHPDQHAAVLTKTPTGTRAYVGNDGGVWRQDATGGNFDNDHWENLNATLATLQPYRAAMSTDGTIYFGLQDNGVGKTTGPATGSAVLGGDGMNVAVHPTNSKIAYAEGPDGDLNRTVDGGVSWSAIAPTLTAPQFVTPFDMDPLNAKHFMIAAREVYMTTALETVDGDGWTLVFDLGANADDFDNSATATALRGANAYVGFCGVCDPIVESATDVTKFHNGLATNVKDGCTAADAGAACWHVAAAKGLPNRFIADLAIDPDDPKTVFATLGGYGRRWYAPPANAPNVGSGHLFVSHDGGENFTDISGNLPDSPAMAVVLRNNSLIVGMDDGVFIAERTAGGVGPFTRLSAGIPHVAIWDLQLDPTGKILVAATHGRGVWVYAFSDTRSAPTGVIAVTGRDDALPLPMVLLGMAVALRVATRGLGGWRRRPGRSAR